MAFKMSQEFPAFSLDITDINIWKNFVNFVGPELGFRE